MYDTNRTPVDGVAASNGTGGANTSLDLIDQQALRIEELPEGLIREIARYLYWNAYYPNVTIAFVGAMGLLAGICGRAFNINDAGLNLYILLLAPTGTGKEAISEGLSRLLFEVSKAIPAAKNIRGPGELVSAPGLIKWLARMQFPFAFSIISEFALMVEQMTGKNPNPNMKGVKGALLKLYHKSGAGGIFDDIAYSEKDNNPGALLSPAFTIIGEGTPDFFNHVDADNITEGFISRLNIHEATEKRPYENMRRVTKPSDELVEKIAELLVECLALSEAGDVRGVSTQWEVFSRFNEFERLATDEINKTVHGATRQLWNRTALKAKKYAALAAIGRDPHKPEINSDQCEWATKMIFDQTMTLIAKFDSGETGAVAGNEARQEAAVLRAIQDYIELPFARFKSYGVTEKMHAERVFTQSFLLNRCRNLPAFSQDRLGPSKALDRTLYNLAHVTAVFLEMSDDQMKKDYNSRSKAFTIGDPRLYFELVGKPVPEDKNAKSRNLFG